MRTCMIVNDRTKKFIVTDTETFDGDWKENYPHTKGEDWLDVYSFSLWEHDKTSNGIYFGYDLCRDGGYFTLYADTTKHTEEDIRKAKAEIRFKHDVVTLRVLKLTPAQKEN